jgi:hypothetical protein
MTTEATCGTYVLRLYAYRLSVTIPYIFVAFTGSGSRGTALSFHLFTAFMHTQSAKLLVVESHFFCICLFAV